MIVVGCGRDRLQVAFWRLLVEREGVFGDLGWEVLERFAGGFEWVDRASDDVDRVFLLAQRPFDDDKRLATDDQPALLVKLGVDDHVGETSFILQQQEGHPLGGAWTLATDDQTTD